MDKAREAMFLKEHRKNEQQQPKIRELKSADAKQEAINRQAAAEISRSPAFPTILLQKGRAVLSLGRTQG